MAESATAHEAWRESFDALRSLAAERDLSERELDQLARAAYALGHLEVALEAWEQLHGRRLAAGDHLGAADAATTIATYLMMDTGLMAPVRAWTRRAERLLEDHDETATHAWLAMVRTYERFMSGDMEQARQWAERAVDVGVRQHAPAPAAIGRVALARLRILHGEVDEGLRLLDEAAVAIVSGELDPLSVGMVYCELICAMQGLAQYDKAEQWTEAMEGWRHGNAFGGINGRCRVHRAEILRLRGSTEAEDEALHACAELRPWMRREFGWPLTELGTIRLRKGDLAGAEQAFLAAHEHGWDPQPGLALLRLAQGDLPAATELITDALQRPSNIPSKERPPYGTLPRAPLLEAQTEIALAAGDVATARRAADELTEIAATFRSRALEASASLARGRVAVAACDPASAIRECATAVDAWNDVGAPHEAAVARLALAAAHRVAGNNDRALMEAMAARSALERIGARLKAEEAAAACGEAHARRASQPAAVGAPSNVFRLEGDTRSITYDGRAVLLKDLKGLRYLARLLDEPGREFHVLDLVSVEGRPPREDDGGPVLDATAKEAFRRRLQEIDDDIDEAARLGDPERVALAEADRDYIIRELSRAFGLGGRARAMDSTSERARASVTRSLRYAMARIAEHHPSLAGHLEQTVHTGTYCRYVPDPRVPMRWET